MSPEWCLNGKTTSIGVERDRVFAGDFLGKLEGTGIVACQGT